MKESRDFSCVKIINDHFNDLRSDLILINSCDEFKRSKYKRGIMFDFLQIGELVNRLSDTFLNNFNNKNVKHVISIRNKIVHMMPPPPWAMPGRNLPAPSPKPAAAAVSPRGIRTAMIGATG